jgi:hypothetical protein
LLVNDPLPEDRTVVTPLDIQHGLRHFEPGALASFSARSVKSLNGDDSLAAAAVVSPIEALVARFPVVRRLAGDESFLAMARRFVASEPPRTSTLHQYGDTFPRFLRRQGKSASIEYVADIAELEMAWSKACRAADTPEGIAKIRDGAASLGHSVADESKTVGHSVAEKSEHAGHAIADAARRIGLDVKAGAQKVKAAVVHDGTRPKE